MGDRPTCGRLVAGAAAVCSRGEGRQFLGPRGDLRPVDWKPLGRSVRRDPVGGLLMTTVGQENARMLASLLGIDEADAAERLDKTVLVTAAPCLADAAGEVEDLLERTIHAARPSQGKPDLELVLGPAEPATP